MSRFGDLDIKQLIERVANRLLISLCQTTGLSNN